MTTYQLPEPFWILNLFAGGKQDLLKRINPVAIETTNLYTADQMQAAYAASVAEGVPDGWKLVPAVPCENMEVAGVEKSLLGRPSVDDGTYVVGIYHAMLAAAPEQNHD